MKLKKESALREVKKLKETLNKWGNILVPTLPNEKSTFAIDRLKYFVNYLINEEKLTIDEIERDMLELS